ncbi:MAG: 50S ribosomal protein L21e [Candidatus Pacearchaeota archaeon]|nr:50S ribosomal protein L21e [Candidatus Pacearchaeota archaeon]
MLKQKQIRQRGKISLTRFFQKFNIGDNVAIVRELSIPLSLPKRLQGRTGKILAKRGSAYEIEIKDFNKPKIYIVHPIHLKKIETK